LKKLFLLPLLILLVISFILTGCNGAAAPTTTAAPTTAAPTTAAPTTAASTTAAPTTAAPTTAAAKKTLTIGLICDLTNSLGNQVMRWNDAVVAMVNAKGGVKVGSDTYLIKTITYSNDNDFNKGVAAANRLIFQDKVKFIISHGIITADYICPIAEPQKVLTFCTSTIWNSGFLDKWHYNFAVLGQGTGELAVAGYMIENHPEFKDVGGMAVVAPDNAAGHQSVSNYSYPYKRLGAQPQYVYYPADQRDLSSLGTKIKIANPKWVIPAISGVENIALALSSMRDAGYAGNMFMFLTSDVALLKPVFPPSVLENFICSMTAMEYGDFNGCMTQLAADMKDAYSQKYGKWDYADYMTAPMTLGLFAALEKAGSIDVEAVNKVMREGLTFPVPDGSMQMISRPDMRLDGACVDGVSDRTMKQIKNGAPTVMTHFGPDVTLGYVRKAYPPLPPGATPSIFPPA
jgi:ABC-type branched-subunit amino acid transport system substrate-binding protein